MLKDYFIKVTKDALNKAIDEKKLNIDKNIQIDFVCDKPKNKEFGDFAINVSSLCRYAKTSPLVLAQTICKYIQSENFSIGVVSGFINFKLEKEFLNNIVAEILSKKQNYLQTNIGNFKKVNIEYVSANPTGPFHIGHGRWAALGSALANIMKYCGYDVF